MKLHGDQLRAPRGKRWVSLKHAHGVSPRPQPPGGSGDTDLVIDLPLQLDNLVLHAHVEALQVLRGARLDPEGLQRLLGLEPPEAALDDNGRTPQPLEAPASHPAPHVLLDDGGLVLPEDLAAGGLWLGFPVYAWKLFREIYFIPGVLLKAYIYIYMLNKCLEKNAALPPSWALLSKAQIQASSKKFPCEKLQIILDY